MAYEILIDRKAKKVLATLDQETARRIHGVLAVLSIDPRPPGVRKVANSPYYRARVGVYRIIFEIVDSKLIVHVVRIEHRHSAYRGLSS